MSLKSLRESLCREQTYPSSKDWPSDIGSAVDVLLNMIDRHRPLGTDGRHSRHPELHTATCGCEDVPSSSTPAER